MDTTKGVSNPLVDMKVAGSNIFGTNYRGGTYGYTRTYDDGSAKKHGGLDIKADIGTPVFAMYDGIVTKTVFSLPTDEHGIGYGNQIRIKSIINGIELEFLYAHLESGNAISANPRTSERFKVGDFVFRGELIGHTGASGNAYNVKNKHLHLGVFDSQGDDLDPAPYINGKIDVGTINDTKGEITDITCD